LRWSGVALRLGGWALLLCIFDGSVQAQSAPAKLAFDLGFSRAFPPSVVTGEAASYLLLGARFDVPVSAGASLFGSLFGGLTPDNRTGDWGSARLGMQAFTRSDRPVSVGLTLSGEGFGVGDPTSYRAAVFRATPELRVRIGSAYLSLRGYAGAGSSRVRRLTRRRRRVDRRRGALVITPLWMAGGGGEINVPIGPSWLIFGADGSSAGAGGFGSAYVGGSGPLPGGLSWTLEVRGWDTPDRHEGAAIASLRVPIGRSFTAETSGGRYGPDPLLDTPADASLATVLSWQALREHAGPEPPARIVDRERSLVRFTLRAPLAFEVTLAGDFSGWESLPMQPHGDEWVLEMAVEPGTHFFGFRVDGVWIVPLGAERVQDEWGQQSAVLVVPAP